MSEIARTNVPDKDLFERAVERVRDSNGSSKSRAQLAREAILAVADAETTDPRELLGLVMDYRDVTPKQLPLMAGRGRRRMHTARMTASQQRKLPSIYKPYDKPAIYAAFDQLRVGTPVIAHSGNEYGVVAEPIGVMVQDCLLALDACVHIRLERLEPLQTRSGTGQVYPASEAILIDIKDLTDPHTIAIGQAAVSGLIHTSFKGTHGIPIGNPLYRDNLESLQRIRQAVTELADQSVLEPVGLENLESQIQRGEDHRRYQRYIDGQMQQSDDWLARALRHPLT